MFYFLILIYVLTGFSFLLLTFAGFQGYIHLHLLGMNHPAFGILTAIVYLFTEVLIMFFFVGVGSSIKEYSIEKKLNPSFQKRSLEIKRKVYPPTLLNTLLIMAVFIIGGGVDTNVVPDWIHGTLFLVSYLHFAYTIHVQHTSLKQITAVTIEMAGSLAGSS